MFVCCRAHLIELLESRRLLAASPVDVHGTAGRDYIEVTADLDAVVITVNGVAQRHKLVDVSALNVFCGDGNDIVIATASPIGIYVDLGNGDDKILGSDHPDTILGAAGKDQIYGGGGNDRLNGAGGNDKIFGEAGADRLYGGDGNDYIDGGSSGDRFYPGGGSDTCLGQSGNDYFFSVDRVADYLFGGSGTDTAVCDSFDIRGSIEFVALA